MTEFRTLWLVVQNYTFEHTRKHTETNIFHRISRCNICLQINYWHGWCVKRQKYAWRKSYTWNTRQLSLLFLVCCETFAYIHGKSATVRTECYNSNLFVFRQLFHHANRHRGIINQRNLWKQQITPKLWINKLVNNPVNTKTRDIYCKRHTRPSSWPRASIAPSGEKAAQKIWLLICIGCATKACVSVFQA